MVGLEACATAQYWARELGALGHEVRLMPAQYVKAYIKRNKHDAADAEAICEAVQRPRMRFVPIKTAEQQAAQLLHRGREQLVRQRTMLVNALRAHLAEFGLVAAQGLRGAGACERAMTRDGTVGRSDATERSLPFHWDIDPARMMRPRFADSIRASSPSGLREQAGHMTASDFCAARYIFSCQAGAIHT